MNPGSNGRYREREHSDVQRPRRRLVRVRHRPGPRDARRPAGSTGASSSSRASPSRDRLWLQASYVYSSLRGNYDGGVNQGVTGSARPGPGSTPTSTIPRWRTTPTGLSPRSAAPLPPGRLLGHALATFCRPSGVRRVGRAAQQAGLLQRVLRRVRLSRSARLGGPAADALGHRTSRSPTRSRSGRRP